jgi:hypothetical protein
MNQTCQGVGVQRHGETDTHRRLSGDTVSAAQVVERRMR